MTEAPSACLSGGTEERRGVFHCPASNLPSAGGLDGD